MTPTRPATTIMTLLFATILLAAGIAHAQNATSEPAPPSDDEGPRNLTLEGTLYDADTEEPIPGADIRIHNAWHDGEDRGHERIEIQTGDDGTFQTDVSPGEVRLEIVADGYDHAHTGFPIEDDAVLQIPIEPAGEEGALLEGTILSDQGEPLPDATVHIRPAHTASPSPYDEDRHDEGRTINVNGHEAHLRYNPQHDTHAYERTDEDGAFQAQLAEGAYHVQARASEHVFNHEEVTLEAGATRDVTLTLKSIPDASVTVEGTILDQDTGEPIPNAYVTVINDRWGQHERVSADAEGAYEVDVVPGPLLIEARAGEHDTVPCEIAHDDAEPAYGDRCRVQRDQAYLPRVSMGKASQGETVTVTLELLRAPTPDATLSGWVINATSEEGIPNATVMVRNEITGDWGSAETDEHGSFTIPVHPGYYTVRIQHAEHPVASLNVEVDEGEEKRVTIEAPPGPVHNREGPHAMPHVAMEGEAYDEAPQASTSMDDASAGAEASRFEEAGGEAGTQTYEGSEGGLGPYQGSEQAVPWVGALGTLALITIGAAWRTTRGPR